MKHIDLDSLPTYTKQELAEHQLDRAIRLLLDESDAISAVTLAGAAEDILGTLVEAGGGTHSLQEFINDCLSMGVRMGENWKSKDFASIANFYRNELKHYSQGERITVSAVCAHELIERAAENLWRLSGRQTEQVRRYMARTYGM